MHYADFTLLWHLSISTISFTSVCHLYLYVKVCTDRGPLTHTHAHTPAMDIRAKQRKKVLFVNWSCYMVTEYSCTILKHHHTNVCCALVLLCLHGEFRVSDATEIRISNLQFITANCHCENDVFFSLENTGCIYYRTIVPTVSQPKSGGSIDKTFSWQRDY